MTNTLKSICISYLHVAIEHRVHARTYAHTHLNRSALMKKNDDQNISRRNTQQWEWKKIQPFAIVQIYRHTHARWTKFIQTYHNHIWFLGIRHVSHRDCFIGRKPLVIITSIVGTCNIVCSFIVHTAVRSHFSFLSCSIFRVYSKHFESLSPEPAHIHMTLHVHRHLNVGYAWATYLIFKSLKNGKEKNRFERCTRVNVSFSN